MVNQAVEKTLVQKLISGDESAFKAIFDCYKNKLYSFSLKITKSEDLAEEIVHDVFLKIWTGRDRINTEMSFDAYLFKITKNASLNFLKKAAADKALKRKLFAFLENIDHHTEYSIISSDDEHFLTKAIETLPPQQQLVFKMSRMEGMTHTQIADILKISKGTVKNYIMLATARLSKQLNVYSDKTLLFMLYWLLVG